jgi:phosphoacetylglucosamine mutase
VDRTAVITANAETVVVRPPGIQEAINAETGNNILLIDVLN